MLGLIGNALGLGIKIMDKIEKNSDKASFEEFKKRKKEKQKRTIRWMYIIKIIIH